MSRLSSKSVRKSGAVELNSRSPHRSVDRLARPSGPCRPGCWSCSAARPGPARRNRGRSAPGRPGRRSSPSDWRWRRRPGPDRPAADGRLLPRGGRRRGSSRRCEAVRTSTPFLRSSASIRRDEPVGAALERVHALRHEVREHDAVGQGRVFQRRAVGVGDRLHQQPHTSSRPGKNRSKSSLRRDRLVVVEVHRPGGVEEFLDACSGATPNRSISSRVKSSRSKVVESENIGLSKRMFLSCTIESAISRVQ